jgi:hypothetical protein
MEISLLAQTICHKPNSDSNSSTHHGIKHFYLYEWLKSSRRTFNRIIISTIQY